MMAHFVGASINDGIVTWDALDLDRMEAISIRRRIYDKRAKLTKPFGEPSFPDWDKRSFVRKWSDEQRTEMEIVSRWRLDFDQAEAFVCVANGAWSASLQDKKQGSMITDAFADARFLFDRRNEGSAIFIYERGYSRGGPLDVVSHEIFTSAPKYKW
jgi:hypothetical protein